MCYPSDYSFPVFKWIRLAFVGLLARRLEMGSKLARSLLIFLCYFSFGSADNYIHTGSFQLFAFAFRLFLGEILSLILFKPVIFWFMLTDFVPESYFYRMFFNFFWRPPDIVAWSYILKFYVCSASYHFPSFNFWTHLCNPSFYTPYLFPPPLL